MSGEQVRPPRLDELTPPFAVQRSERGRLLPPDLDDRRWADLVDEASALIDRYAPQWTDRSPSDIGMTIVELFAWLTETLIYRLNRVPDKQYVALLNLLGVTRRPPVPARTLLTFSVAGGAVTVGEGAPAQTAGTESDAPVVFETDTPLLVVPGAVTDVVRADRPVRAAPPPGRPAAPAGAVAVDLAAGEAMQLTLGIDSPVGPPAAVDVYVEPVRPPVDRQADERIEWLYTVTTAADPDPLAWDGVTWGPWRRLTVLADGTRGLVRPGVVRLRVGDGPGWAAVKPGETQWSVPGAAFPDVARFWLALRISNVTDVLHPQRTVPPLRLDLDRVLLNTAPALAVATVTDEDLGTGTGQARQVVRLARWPVYARTGTDTPYDHVQISVGGAPWRLVESLPDGPGTCYLLDAVTGEITFGDHDPVSGLGRGTVPAAEQPIRAVRYRYVTAGTRGNVAAHTLRVLTAGGSLVSGTGTLTGVRNPVAAVGGVDEEPVEEAKRRAPEVLRHRDRAVTVDDYEQLARDAVPGIALVRCLPPRRHTPTAPQQWLVDDPWTYGNLLRSSGMVNVVVVPDLGPDVPEPTPSLALQQDVLRVLDRRRPVATALHVTGPRYVPVKVVAKAVVFQSAINRGLVTSEVEVAETITARIRAFLHPVRGGRQGTGWQIGQGVNVTDVYQAIRLPDDVGYVSALDLAPQRPRYFVEGPSDADQRPVPDVLGRLTKQVRVADYELICCGDLDVEDPEVEDT